MQAKYFNCINGILFDRNHDEPLLIYSTEAVTRRWFAENVFLKISQNSQENISARVSFLIKLEAFCAISTTLLLSTFSRAKFK